MVGEKNFHRTKVPPPHHHKAHSDPSRCLPKILAHISHIFLNSKLSSVVSVRVVFRQMIRSDHYESNHTATKAHPVPTEIRHKIRDYMATLDLCDPRKIIPPNRLIPELKIIEKGFVCNFPGCGACRTSEHSMRTHYYTHQKSIPKDFKDWEETSLQTFFDGQNKK